MQYLILGMLALVLVLFFVEAKRGARSSIWVRRGRIALGILVLAAAAGLFVRGAAGPASVLAALGFWLVGGAGAGGFGGLSGGPKTPGQSSHVMTDYLEVALDHDTGALSGQVIKGPFAGRALETMTAAELIDLWQVCATDDPPSAQVIEAVLDRQHSDWRNWADGHSAGETRSEAGGAEGDGIMSRAQAYKVLGLKPGASELEIRAAHRDLMQKVHPDHGGSTVLAAQINQAKDILLG